MDAFAEFFASHRRGVLVAAAVLLAATALSVARCSSLAEQRAHDAAQEQQVEEPSGGSTSPDYASLTDAQRELVSGYGPDERGFVQSLESYIWASADGASAVAFSGNAFSFSRDGKTAALKPFAVSALSGASVSAEAGAASDDASPTVASLLMEDGGTVIVSIGRIPSADGAIGLAMTTDAFSGSRMVYIAERASDGVSVKGITDDAEAALGGDARDLIEAVESHVESAYPTASTASWEGDLLLDYRDGTAQMSFGLDDARQSKIVVTWHLDDGTFDFGGVR